MLQHACNCKLLYFIDLINKMIKWLEKHKHHIFLKQEQWLLANFYLNTKVKIRVLHSQILHKSFIWTRSNSDRHGARYM
jgi:hypothetical protein